MITIFVSDGGVTAVHADTAERVSIFYENVAGNYIVETEAGGTYRALRDDSINRVMPKNEPPKEGLFPKVSTWRDTFEEWINRNIPKVVTDAPESYEFLNTYEDDAVEALLAGEYDELKLVRKILDDWDSFITK